MSEHELWNELGNLYFLSGSYNQAIHAYTRSIALDKNFGRPYSNMALAYVQKGKYLEAIDLYQLGIKLLKDDEEKAWSWFKLGNVYRQLKDYRRAVDAYERADKLDPAYRENELSTNKADALLNRKPTLEDTYLLVDETPIVEGKDEPAPVPAPISAPETMEEIQTPVTDQKPEIVIMEEDQVPASSPTSELIPLPEELTPWSFDEEIVPEEEPWPDFELWATDEAGVIGPDENIIFTDPLKWELKPAEEISMADGSPQFEMKITEETVTPSPVMDMADNNQCMSVMISPGTDFSVQVHQMGQREQQTVETQTVVVEEKPVPFVFVVPEGEDMTETPEFVAENITSPEAVQYETPTELPAFELSPEELAKIQVDIDKFKRVLEINPRNAFAWDTIGGLYKASSRYDEAIHAYQKAISIDSSRSVYFYHLGLVYAAERKLEDAILAFQRVIEIDPNYSLAHATLGGYYRRMGREELAKEHIDKAMSFLSDDENEYNRACMEAICGNTDRAFELLEIALENKQTVIEWVRRDPDLDFIRSDPRFNTLLLDYATRPTP